MARVIHACIHLYSVILSSRDLSALVACGLADWAPSHLVTRLPPYPSARMAFVCNGLQATLSQFV